MSTPPPEGTPPREEEEYEPEPSPPPAPKKEEAASRPKPKMAEESSGISEAQQMIEDKKRKDKERMDEEMREYEEMRKEEREKIKLEIDELVEKKERRKAERAEEERRMAEARAIEEQRRRAEEEERQRKKREELEAKKAERDRKRQEAEDRAKNMGKRSFVITRKHKSGTDEAGEEEHKDVAVKSKEQLEAEKKAILEQRITPVGDVSALDETGLKKKCAELHAQLARLESDKYDLEQHFKQRQYEMQELADRARQMNKGKKKIAVSQDAAGQDKMDPMAEKFSGIPPKIQLCSKYERHKDRRSYVERKDVFGGPIYAEETPRIEPYWEKEGGANPFLEYGLEVAGAENQPPTSEPQAATEGGED